VISGDVAGEIGKLKESPGGDIVQYGFGQVSATMMEHDLLDELRLWVHPIVVGSGSPEDLLFRKVPQTRLDLVESRSLKNGIVILTYHFK
jgi:dihydrofolate reductase